MSIPFSKEDGLKQISKGRTIHEVIMANLVWGTLGCWVYFAVFGVNSIHIELHGATSMTELLSATTPENAIATILSTLPGQPVTLLLLALLMLIFLATTADSVAYVIASMTTKSLNPGEEPQRWYRLFWVFFLIAIAITIMVLGGMKPIQASSTLGAFPLLFIIVRSVMNQKLE
ncbi:BCCT family transporter [Ammoniphilus sp. 3BR4]|uniref:BCCT family transporter n=1 Tax=Ammoniphilus sp. 3BR4 TaxID=3158265 RepID=UPI003465B835